MRVIAFYIRIKRVSSPTRRRNSLSEFALNPVFLSYRLRTASIFFINRDFVHSTTVASNKNTCSKHMAKTRVQTSIKMSYRATASEFVCLAILYARIFFPLPPLSRIIFFENFICDGCSTRRASYAREIAFVGRNGNNGSASSEELIN